MIRSPSASRGKCRAVWLVAGVAIALGCSFWLGREGHSGADRNQDPDTVQSSEDTIDQPADAVITAGAGPDFLWSKAVGPSSASGQLPPPGTLVSHAQAELLAGLNGVAGIDEFLRSPDFDTVDIETAAAHVAGLPGGVQYLVFAQLKSAGDITELRAARLLAELETSDIALIAADIMLDESSEVRRRTYALLSSEAVKGSHEASAMLLNASYSETDPLSLAALVFGLAAGSTSRVEQGRPLDQAAVARLDDLAGEGNRPVAASALLALARLRPDQRTMQLNSESLASQSTTLRESAVDALANFEQIDGATKATLSALTEDESVPLFIRRRAITTLIEFDQTEP